MIGKQCLIFLLYLQETMVETNTNRWEKQWCKQILINDRNKKTYSIACDHPCETWVRVQPALFVQEKRKHTMKDSEINGNHHRSNAIHVKQDNDNVEDIHKERKDDRINGCRNHRKTRNAVGNFELVSLPLSPQCTC